MNAAQAIHASTTENRIIYLDWEPGLETVLMSASSDMFNGGSVVYFWGVSDTGHPWRVHLVTRKMQEQ